MAWPGRKLNDDGTIEPTDQQKEFIEWLLDPAKDKGTQTDWAREHNVHQNTLARWKKDEDFIDAWEKRAEELNVSVDRIQKVIDAVYRQATAGDVKAASLYLQYVDRFTPKRKIVDDGGRDLSNLTDEELEGALENVRSIRSARKAK